MPNLIAVASETSTRSRITTSVAVMFGGMPMGGVAVSLLATYLPPAEHWRVLFYVGGILPIVIAPLLVYGLPETHSAPAASGSADTQRKGQVLSALFGPGQRLISISLWIAFILTLAQLYILLNWLPTLIENRGLGASLGTTGALMLNVGSIAGAFLVGFMCDKWGVRWPMLFVYAVMILSMLALTQVSGFWSVIVVCSVAGFAVVGAQFALYGLAPQFYPDAVRGASAGAAVAAGRVGSVAGPAVAGILLGMGLTAQQVILTTIPSIAAGGVALLVLTFVGAAYSSRNMAKDSP
jgi:AAHS family 3-hydroxyphenylpropionic acid transporter